jgi:hypothetical protein
MRNNLSTGVKALSLIAALLAVPAISQAQDASPYRGPGLSQQDLTRARARGSEDQPVNQAELFRNSANGAITGHNTIDASSFANSGGIISVIQNTGNNSLFQHSTTVNVTVR